MKHAFWRQPASFIPFFFFTKKMQFRVLKTLYRSDMYFDYVTSNIFERNGNTFSIFFFKRMLNVKD